MPMHMYLPCTVECDSCGAELELAYRLDLATAHRAKGLFKPAWLRDVRREVERSASGSGWSLTAAGCYCPQCADGLEAGALRPASATDPRALIADVAMIVRSRRLARAEREEGGE